MEEIWKVYLDKDIKLNDAKLEFDYNFSSESSVEEFENEFKTFLFLNKSLYYNGNRLIGYIGNEYIPTKEILEQLIKMYLYAKNNKLFKEQKIIEEFLITLYYTITNFEYKAKVIESENILKDLRIILDDNKLTKDFFNDFYDYCFIYYKELIEIAAKNDDKFRFYQISRMLNNFANKEKEYNEIVDLLLKNNINLCDVVKYDKQKKDHIVIYLKYIIDSLERFGGYNYAKEMIAELAKNKSLEGDNLKIVINEYVKVTNKLCHKLQIKEGYFMDRLTDIDNLKIELQFVIKHVTYLSKDEKNVLHKCLENLLRLKRYVLSDKEFVNKNSILFTAESNVPRKKIDEFKNELNNNCLKIYSASKEDFVTGVCTAIEMYSKNPLDNLVTNYTIDSEKQTYKKDTTWDKESTFADIFNKIGKEYSDKNSNILINKLKDEEIYTIFLNYISKVFNIHQSLLLQMLQEDGFNNLINNLKQCFEYNNTNNNYAIIVINILTIEHFMYQMLKNKGENPTDKGQININKLAKLYKDDKDILNGLMYINYTLYEKDGLNLRNNIMHGNMINSDLKIPLITTFSGLIFINWMDHGR